MQAALLTASSSVVVGDPTTILPPWLYLGGARQALDLERLRKLGITHVLNVAGEVACFHADAGIVYEDLGKAVRDVPTYPICQHFGKAIAFIEDARSCGGRVLVHCAAGPLQAGFEPPWLNRCLYRSQPIAHDGHCIPDRDIRVVVVVVVHPLQIVASCGRT